jgi:hypothetical protein
MFIKTSGDVSKDRSAFITGLVQHKDEVNTVVRNGGV